MDHNDRQAIEDLFGKLADVERQAAPRDERAEALIKERIAGQPSATYFMAQTIVVQDQALNAAQQRIEELEYQLSNRPAQGGLLSSLFRGSAPANRPSSPRPSSATASGPWGQQAGSPMLAARGGGFLAGAAQTAMGVAGGVLLGNAIAGMLGGSEANAAGKADPQEEQEDAGDNDFGDAEL